MPLLHHVPTRRIQGKLYFVCHLLISVFDASSWLTSTEYHSACCRHACFMGNTIYNKWLWRHKWEFSSTVHTIHCIWYRSASFWLLLQYHGSLCNDALSKSGGVASNRWWWQMNSKGASGIQVKRMLAPVVSLLRFTSPHVRLNFIITCEISGQMLEFGLAS